MSPQNSNTYNCLSYIGDKWRAELQRQDIPAPLSLVLSPEQRIACLPKLQKVTSTLGFLEVAAFIPIEPIKFLTFFF
jgi:uncharacterized protein YbdZ (MbtH family)